MAAADARRMEGSCRRRSTRTSACCSTGCRAASSRSSARGTGRTRCRPRSWRRRSRTGTRSCGPRRPRRSICAAKLAACLEAADIPPGVVNMVTGPGPVVGDEIAGDPRTQAVGFIGSIATGLHGRRRAAGKELLLEMGGNGPLVVMDDADLDAAVGGHADGVLPERGPELHGRRADPGARGRARGVPRAPVRRDRGADPDRAIRSTTPRRWGRVNNEPTVAKTERHVRDAVDRGAVGAGGRRAARRATAATSSTRRP